MELIKYFHEHDHGRTSLFSPVVKDKMIDYKDVINLSKVEDNLKNGLYTSDYWMFIKDITMSFEFINKNFISRMPIFKLAIEVRLINYTCAKTK